MNLVATLTDLERENRTLMMALEQSIQDKARLYQQVATLEKEVEKLTQVLDQLRR